MRTQTDLDAATQRRGETSDAIAGSAARKKLIVAGPGTGKTHNFRRVLQAVDGEGLALTFIKALEAELEKDLGDIARVNTLHGYCKSLAHKAGGVDGLSAQFDYFPGLLRLLAADIGLLRGSSLPEGRLDECLHNLDDSDGLLTGVLRLGEFYDAMSHTDAVYRVLRYLEANPERIPKHPLVVVDEYQDFSLLETKFIDALATASPVLIAGDDDQALYGFKHASANFIRQLAEDDSYERFHLPYCSRCTEVIVDAVNNVVANAQRLGHLADRLDREYLCYLPDKLVESDAHPSIIHARCSVQAKRTPYMGDYVAQQIAAIPEADVKDSREKGYPTALVIGPSHFVTAVHDVLKKQFPDTVLRLSDPASIDPLDGYQRLAENPASSLGWRVILESRGFSGHRAAVREAITAGTPLADVLSDEYQEKHLRIAAVIGKLIGGEEISADEEDLLTTEFETDLDQIRRRLGLITTDTEVSDDEALELDGPSVVCTSLVGAKGLQAGHVFIVGFNDGAFPVRPSEITDDDVCKFIVGLSRTRKECHLVSCGRYAGKPMRVSTFLDWLEVPIEERNVNRDYWDRTKEAAHVK